MAKTKGVVSKPPLTGAAVVDFAEAKASKAGRKSGQVPMGDVRLTANILADLHLKLRMQAL